jgi:hypothetical protein
MHNPLLILLLLKGVYSKPHFIPLLKVKVSKVDYSMDYSSKSKNTVWLCVWQYANTVTFALAATSTVYCTTVQDKNIYKLLISGSCPIFVVMTVLGTIHSTKFSNPRRIDAKNSFKNDQRPTTSRENKIRKHLNLPDQFFKF